MKLAKHTKKSEEDQQKKEVTKIVSSILSSSGFKKELDKGKVSNNAIASAATASSMESTSGVSSKFNHIIGKATHSKKKS